MSVLVSGNDVSFKAVLRIQNKTFTINPTDTVKAAVITKKREVIIPTTTVVEGTTGDDWVNSKVVVVFSNILTSAITTFGDMLLEIQVDGDAGKLTWFIPVDVQQGTIV